MKSRLRPETYRGIRILMTILLVLLFAMLAAGVYYGTHGNADDTDGIAIKVLVGFSIGMIVICFGVGIGTYLAEPVQKNDSDDLEEEVVK